MRSAIGISNRLLSNIGYQNIS